MGGGGGKGKSSYKNPVSISVSVQGVYVGAVKGYSGVGDVTTSDLSLDQFLETVRLETQKADLSNLGHPLYRPFTVRRFGYDIGVPEPHNLAYDAVSTMYLAFCQLQEGMRVFATGRYSLYDDFQVAVGDTITVEDISMGVRRLFLVTGLTETPEGLELTLLDVLGG